MKPRLKKRDGLWYCAVLEQVSLRKPVGVGYTPKEAHTAWLLLWELA